MNDWIKSKDYDDIYADNNVDPNSEAYELYYAYYGKAKQAIDKMGLEALLFDRFEGKAIQIANRFFFMLFSDIVAIYDNGEQMFFYDPNTKEMRAVYGKWIDLVDVLYNTMLEVDAKKAKTKKYDE